MAKNKKKSAAGIFFSFFLKAIVIILGLVILAMGAYLIRYTLKAENSDDQSIDDSILIEPDDDVLFASDSDAATEAGDDDLLFDGESEGQDGSGTIEIGYDQHIVVLNATDTAGLAGAWRDRLTGEGFQSVDVGNYYGDHLTDTRIVIPEEGVGGNLKNYFSAAEIENVSTDTVACDVSLEGAAAVIIIGNADDIVSQ